MSRRAEQDPLGTRLKNLYEKPEESRRFTPMLPVIVRLDGKNFSRFTRGMNRPYDERLVRVM